MILKRIYLFLTICLMTVNCYGCSSSDGNPAPTPTPPTPPTPPAPSENFETSYWIDMDLLGKHLRGYWYNVNKSDPDQIPTEISVQNACLRLRNDYSGDKIYLIYHRQFEIEEAKTSFAMWKRCAKVNNMTVVPTIVLQSYDNPSTMNFSDSEITQFAGWCNANINKEEFGIYDVYTRDAAGTTQDKQLKLIKQQIGNVLVMVGIQPNVTMNSSYKSGVQDAWTAECQGKTNALWENPVNYKGSKNYGRKLLEAWVKERVNGETRHIVWNMIPVAWDYETDDPLSYDCPGDDAIKNDPPIPGRIALCDKYISLCYPNGKSNPLFAGYSCDLHILQANSGGRRESPSFYEALRTNVDYNGDFSAVMKEIGTLYKSIKQKK